MPDDPGIVTPLEIISREQLEALEAAGWEISRPIDLDGHDVRTCDCAECQRFRYEQAGDGAHIDGSPSPNQGESE